MFTDFILYVAVIGAALEDGLTVQKYIRYPSSLILTTAIQHPFSELHYIGATANSLVEIDWRGGCSTLVGPSTRDCPTKDICSNNTQDLINTVQLRYHTINGSVSSAVYVLTNTSLWNMNVVSCTTTVIADFSSGSSQPRSMVSSCGDTIQILFSDTDPSSSEPYLLSIRNETVEETRTLPSFMSGYRFPVVNADCTKKLEVHAGDSLSDIRNYAWIGFRLLFKDYEGRVYNYRKTDDRAYLHFNLERKMSKVDTMTNVPNEDVMIFTRTTQYCILIASLNPWTAVTSKSLLLQLPKFKNDVIGVLKDFENIQHVETCARNCIKSDTCRGFNYFHSEKKCALKSYLRFVKADDAEEVATYIIWN